jgi:tRNA(fMet)-specific endonuclease VapC
MPLYVLDTDTVTLFRKSHPEVTSRVTATPAGHLATTVITVEEVLGGWYAAVRKAARPDEIETAYNRLAEVVGFFTGFAVLTFPQSAIARYEAFRKQKLNVGGNDLRIAAIAPEAGAIVVTRNVRGFGRVPNLAVEDWSQPAAP